MSRRNIIALFGVAAAAAGCTPPTLTGFAPGSGYPRQLLGVDGSTVFASVVWDAGLPTEAALYNGLFGTNYFQIPAGASPGVHPVALRNSHGSSGIVNVTVLPASGVFPAPRIEDVGVLVLSGTGPVDLALVVTGANLDVNATVTINGVAPPTTVRWGALPVDYLLSHTPSTFGYPIYHYVQLLSVVEDVALGTTLTVAVTNTDGLSATSTYTLPATVAELDSDGDGLLNAWENGSYTAPSGGTVALSAMGTRQWRKDILVEADWISAAVPNATIWPTIEAVFADAPVLNVDGSRGVNIIIDRGQGGAFTGGGTVLADHIWMGFETNPTSGYARFSDYKAASSSPDRLNLFHYAVFGRARTDGRPGFGEIWGNDFMVTVADYAIGTRDVVQVGLFVHELGHNLALTHGNLFTGPQASKTRKPNFASTMSYRWQYDGVSTDCDWASEGIHTYSVGHYARIQESAVNESIGICDGAPLDMNGDGLITTVTIDFDGGGLVPAALDDFNQWGSLRLNFRAAGSAWGGN